MVSVRDVKQKEIEFNESKFKELLIYVAAKCEKDLYYGAVKLNKILFFSDFLAYEALGESITGADYFALELGPAPRPLKPIQEKMIKAGEIAVEKRTSQKRTIALREPNLDSFSAPEIAIVDKVIDALCDINAGDVSKMSHGFLGWKAAWAEGQDRGTWISIPYETAFVSNPPMDKFEEAHGLGLAKKYGWFAEDSTRV